MKRHEPTIIGTGSDHPGIQPRAARKATGRDAREWLPLEAHGVIGAGGRDPIEVLERQAETRIPELIALRYERMASSAFAFYRGAAALMALDLRAVPSSRIDIQLCGDAHLGNVGVYASPERRLVLDLNDFDETGVGPFEWDVKRMAASFEIAARQNGFSQADRRRLVVGFTRAYAAAVKEASRMTVMSVFRTHIEFDPVVDKLSERLAPDVVQRASRLLTQAKKRDSLQAARSLTEEVDGVRRFKSDPPVLIPLRELIERGRFRAEEAERLLVGMISAYQDSLMPNRRRIVSRYRVIDAALKVVGVGSVGTRAWLLLLRGNSRDDILILQAKEAQRSVLEPADLPTAYDHQGRRVVDGQHVMQALSDPMLGWTQALGVDGTLRDFYVRQFRDMKGSASPERMDPPTLGVYGEYCALVLARAHARGGDAAAITGYIGGGRVFAEAIADYAAAYADRNDVDHALLLQAIASGRVSAAGG